MMNVFNYEKDSAGIVTVTMDMNGSINAMNPEFNSAMDETLDCLEAETGLSGVVFASAKKSFFAGGDLHVFLDAQPGQEQKWFDEGETNKLRLRRLEQLSVPVVAAINGAALGGGFEICLASNYRIAWNDKRVQLGLPEVNLGLLPGAGGVVRLTNLLGLEGALPYLLEGKIVTPEVALNDGLIHETVDRVEQLLPRAKAWILEQGNNESAAIQPWDKKGHKVPGGSANSPALAQLLVTAPTMLWAKTRGEEPAPERILNVAVEAARLDFDTALRVESRNFVPLVIGADAKERIQAFFASRSG